MKSMGLEFVLMNMPVYETKGCGGIPGKEKDFQDQFLQTLMICKLIKCPRIHVLSGFVPNKEARPMHFQTLKENLKYACQKLLDNGCTNYTLTLEVLATVPTYLVTDFSETIEFIRKFDQDLPYSCRERIILSDFFGFRDGK